MKYWSANVKCDGHISSGKEKKKHLDQWNLLDGYFVVSALWIIGLFGCSALNDRNIPLGNTVSDTLASSNNTFSVKHNKICTIQFDNVCLNDNIYRRQQNTISLIIKYK